MALDSEPACTPPRNGVSELNNITRLTWAPSNNKGYCTTGAKIDMEAWASLMRSALPTGTSGDSVWTQGNKTVCTLNVDTAIAENPNFITALQEKLSPTELGDLGMNTALTSEKLTMLLSRDGGKNYEFKPNFDQQKAVGTFKFINAQVIKSVLDDYHIPCVIKPDSATSRLSPKEHRMTVSVPTDPLTVNRLFALDSLGFEQEIKSAIRNRIDLAIATPRQTSR